MRHNKIKWQGKSPINKTFLIAPMGPKSPIMIFNSSGRLLRKKQTAGFPANFVQLSDLSGYSYFAGTTYVGLKPPIGQPDKYCANGRYTVGKLYITDNNLETETVIDYLPTTKIPKAIGLHMHGNYVLGENHYLLQAISFEEVTIENKQTYVVNCILQEQLNGEVIWEWQSIDEPRLFEASFARNNYFCEEAVNKSCACDYAHMNSAVKTSDGKYIYISFKHIGIIKLDYHSKKLIWILGPKVVDLVNFPSDVPMFAHQHDVHLIDDNTFYFWDNAHLRYTEIGIINNVITRYKTFNCPAMCESPVMGNVVKVSEDIIDVCYGMRRPWHENFLKLQPIVSEFDMKSGQKLLDIIIPTKPPKLINIMYQINRGINIYEA